MLRVVRYIFTSYVIIVSISSTVFSQVFENNAGQMEKKFLYEVKQIDEFFERFNDDSSSFIRKIYKSYRIKFNIDRQSLIKSLFNYHTKTWTQSSVDSFARTAVATRLPSKGDFYGEGWYAEVNCRFEYNSSETEISLILRIITDTRKRSKWVITGVKSGTLKFTSVAGIRKSQDNDQKFINPASHGNYFIELGKALDDKKDLSAYFDPSFFSTRSGTPVFEAILQNRLKFISVRDIKYHFLQVPNYIFTVEYFDRNDLNSGWLINHMTQVSLSEKELFKQKLLGE